MKQLDKVLTNTTWAKASNTINLNNDALYVAVTALEHAAFKHKGYFKTVALLQEAYPTAEEGSQAFVYNSANPTTAPYDIYTWTNTGWQDSGVNGGNMDVNLDDKQDTLVGYSETVSNGKATQIAIEGDTIALGGKVSIGQINNLETAILMSSSQASNAETTANTIKSEVSLLKQPVKPLLLNANGKLELSIGQGLYVSDGKLCADRIAGGSGSGGGTIYSEGAGISILDNKISVAYNMETLGIDSCGGLTVNYGEGLTVKNGKLSATNTVTAGAGVSVQNGQVSLNVGTGLNLEQSTDSGGRKVYVAVGRGLEVDNENKINAKVDGATILANSNGALYVNKGVLAGYGLHVLRDKLAVNYGTGLAYDITTGKIHVNYGDGLQSCDGQIVLATGNGLVIDNGKVRVNTDDNTIKVNGNGQLYSTVTSKTYTAGDAISVVGNAINVKYDGVTLSTKDTLDNSLHVVLGNGLKQGTDGVEVDIQGLVLGGGGLMENDGVLGVNVGAGLTIDTCSVAVNYGTGLAVSGGKLYSTVQSTTYTAVNGLEMINNVISVKLATDTNNHNVSGLYISDEALSLKLGSGLQIDTQSGDAVVNIGTGLQIGDDKKLFCNVTSKTYTAGNGVAINGDAISVNYGTGLAVSGGKLYSTVTSKTYEAGDGINLTDNTLSVRLATDTSNKTISGLEMHYGGVRIKCGTGLGIDTESGQVYFNYSFGTGLASNDNSIFVNSSITNDIAANKNNIATLQTAVSKKQNWLTAGCGISLCGDVATILYGSGLTMYNHHLVVNQWDMVKSGGGLRVECDALAVQLGAGLTIDTCSVAVNYGTGMSVGNNKIYIDTSKIAGAGIDLNSDNKKLEIGTQAAKTLAGSGLVADGSKIKVDAANLTVGNASKLGGNDGEWFLNHVVGFKSISPSPSVDADCNAYTCGMIHNYYGLTKWKNAPDGIQYGRVLNLNGGSTKDMLGQLAWDINHASTTDTTRNLWWRASDNGSMTGAKWHQIAFADDIADTYQTKLTMGSGLANTNNKLSISIGTGLSYDTTSGVPCVALAPQSYLKFYDEGNGMASLSVDIEAIRAALNNGGGASPIDEN